VTNAMVLQLIPEIDENLANAIISGPGGRNGPDGLAGTDDDLPYRGVQDMARAMPATPQVLAQLGRFFTFQSFIFKVTVKVDLGGMTRTYHALLRRASPRDIQMLCMDWD